MEKRILVGGGATISRTFYNFESEIPANANNGVAYTLARLDGTLLASGQATWSGLQGIYNVIIPPQPKPDRLVLTWSGAFGAAEAQQQVDYIDVAGGFYFDLAELRAMNGLSDTTTFPTQSLAEARRVTEDLIEAYCRVAFVQRFNRELLDGYGLGTLLGGLARGIDWRTTGSAASMMVERTPNKPLPPGNVSPLIKVLVNQQQGGWTVQDTSTWTLSEWGRISTTGYIFPPAIAGQNLDVQYAHGYLTPPPDVRRAALRLARQVLLTQQSAIPDRAHTMTTDVATFSLTMASEEFPTGLPEVDAVLQQYREWVPRFA